MKKILMPILVGLIMCGSVNTLMPMEREMAISNLLPIGKIILGGACLALSAYRPSNAALKKVLTPIFIGYQHEDSHGNKQEIGIRCNPVPFIAGIWFMRDGIKGLL